VQKHTPPCALEYGRSLHPDKDLTTIMVVGEEINPIVPVKAEVNNHLLFTISPNLPQGLALDPNTGVISGKPELPAARNKFTVTGHNMRGKVTTMIVLAVAGRWQNWEPRDWSREMVQKWLEDEEFMPEDDRYVCVCVVCVCVYCVSQNSVVIYITIFSRRATLREYAVMNVIVITPLRHQPTSTSQPQDVSMYLSMYLCVCVCVCVCVCIGSVLPNSTARS
jgi:hypothetical protein